MNVMFTSRPSPRWLAEKIRSQNTTDAAQVLVRRTLAWVTGLVLVIATLLGVRFIKLDAGFYIVPRVLFDISGHIEVP